MTAEPKTPSGKALASLVNLDVLVANGTNGRGGAPLHADLKAVLSLVAGLCRRALLEAEANDAKIAALVAALERAKAFIDTRRAFGREEVARIDSLLSALSQPRLTTAGPTIEMRKAEHVRADPAQAASDHDAALVAAWRASLEDGK